MLAFPVHRKFTKKLVALFEFEKCNAKILRNFLAILPIVSWRYLR